MMRQLREMRWFYTHQRRRRRSLNFHLNRHRQQLQDKQLLLGAAGVLQKSRSPH
jgi:hypothetical protein